MNQESPHEKKTIEVARSEDNKICLLIPNSMNIFTSDNYKIIPITQKEVHALRDDLKKMLHKKTNN